LEPEVGGGKAGQVRSGQRGKKENLLDGRELLPPLMEGGDLGWMKPEGEQLHNAELETRKYGGEDRKSTKGLESRG